MIMRIGFFDEKEILGYRKSTFIHRKAITSYEAKVLKDINRN